MIVHPVVVRRTTPARKTVTVAPEIASRTAAAGSQEKVLMGTWKTLSYSVYGLSYPYWFQKL